jgi:hypothetical protein
MSRTRKILLGLLAAWVFLVLLYYVAFGLRGG